MNVGENMMIWSRTLALGCGLWIAAGAPGARGAEIDSRPRVAKTVSDTVEWKGERYAVHPRTHSADPGVPSPLEAPEGMVTVTARLADGPFAIVPVTLSQGQRFVNGEEFPELARTGLHAEVALANIRTITGRPVAEITALGRPGGLSGEGFMAEDEDIVSVLAGDNRLVRDLGLTHPELAEPLYHVMNLLETDIGVVYRNHSWDDLEGLLYNGRMIFVKGKGTKGGQRSIFADGIEGAWDLDIWRQPDEKETAFLKRAYSHLGEEKLSRLMDKLSRIHTGEMEPQYIMRYGFYEGHTGYRADPIAIAFVFGLRTVEEIETAFPGRLLDALTGHFTRKTEHQDPGP
jgi:hypothetical protein